MVNICCNLPFYYFCNICLTTVQKKEYIHHKKFDTIEEIKIGIFEYIEKWYNRERIQERIGYLTPVEFEEMSKNGLVQKIGHKVKTNMLKYLYN